MNIGQRSILNVMRWYKSHLNQYRKFRMSLEDGPVPIVSDDPDMGDSDDPVAPSKFGLEADLQAALRENLHQLEPGLEIIDGGVERKVASGFIDILAKDQHGQYVVIELKAGTAKDAVIAQIMGYIGDLAEEENQNVRGIIIAADFVPRVESASKAIPNLSLKSYRYRFEFF